MCFKRLNSFYVNKIGVSALTVRRTARNNDYIAFFNEFTLNCRLFSEIEQDINRRIFVINLLDNAIEGVMRLPATSPSRNVRLEFSKVWDMLFISCRNDADISKIKRHGETFVSTKEQPEIHGFGTENMRRIVNKAGGTIEFDVEMNQFVVQIMIGGSPPC